MAKKAETPTTVVVVGAARGIGMSTALALAKSGANVVGIDLGSDNTEPGYALGNITTADFGEADSQILRIPADARRELEMQHAAKLIAAHFGTIDQLVVSAGAIYGGAPLLETPLAITMAAIEFNLGCLANSVSSLVPLIRLNTDKEMRRVITVLSVAGTKALAGIGPYVAAKHAMAGYMKTLAIELAPDSITVNSVSPGSTRTAMLSRSAQLYGLANEVEFATHHRLGRLIEPTEITTAILFFASREASAITGVDLAVDAGMKL